MRAIQRGRRDPRDHGALFPSACFIEQGSKKFNHHEFDKEKIMGGPGGWGPKVPKPPGGGVAGVEPPLRGVAEDRRAGARGETSPLLLVIELMLINLNQRKL
jgi:hypothetical protein